MTGLLGSLLMMLECSGVGAEIDMDLIPQPALPDDRYLDWLIGFPSYGFVLSARPEFVPSIQAEFSAHGITCAAIGEVTSEPQVILRREEQSSVLQDFSDESFIGFRAAED